MRFGRLALAGQAIFVDDTPFKNAGEGEMQDGAYLDLCPR